MKYKLFLNNILRHIILVFIPFSLIVDVSAQSIILTMPGINMNFLNANKTILVDNGGGGTAVGSVHRYDNLLTTNDITVWGKLTIKEVVNASISNFDDDTPGAGLPARFQPWITTTAANGYVLYELEFFEVITNQRVYVSDYYLTGIDVDGNEIIEIGGYSSYEVDNACQLTITHDPSTGRTKFKGISSSINDITFENTAAFVARYNFPYTKVQFAFGNSGVVANRQFSTQFGTVGGVFTTPLSTYNPKRLLDITKTANTNEFKAGTNNKYTITLENVGAVAKNVVLKDTLPSGLTYVPKSTSVTIPAANVIETLLDNFNLTPVDYGVSNGTVPWKTNWLETGDNNIPSSGKILINAGKLRFSSASTNNSITRTFDLSELSSSDGATLSFDYVENFSTGTIKAQISTDGITYVDIATFNNSSGTGNTSYSIPNTYFTANTYIRFIATTATSGSSNYFDIDNVKIAYYYYKAQQILHNNTGGTLTNGIPPNLLATGDNITLQPGVKATLTFDVSVDCNAKDIITNNAYATCTDMYTPFVKASHVATVNPTTIGASGCTSGNIDLTATGASPDQNYKWYNAATGGTLLQTNGSTYTAVNVNSTTDYYVSFYNTTSGCESGRSKVTATISGVAPTGTAVVSSPTFQNGAGSDTGTKIAGTAATSGTGRDWTNPNNAKGSDNNRATAALSSTGVNSNSKNLDLTNFGLSIPDGSNIIGISASIERMVSGSGTPRVRDLVVQLLKNGVAVGDNKADTGTNWPTSEGTASYGGNADLWGGVWTSAELNNANFGIRIQATYNNGTPTAQIDNVTLTVYYSTFGDDQSSVQFTTTAVSGATSYTWTVPTNATIVGGQGTQTIIVNFNNAVAAGTQNITVQPSNSCGIGVLQNFSIGISNTINNQISGTVYFDPDGSSNSGTSVPPYSRNKVDGIPISTIGGEQLYAILVIRSTGLTEESKPIASDGTYKFSNLFGTSNYYEIWISTTPYGNGSTPTAMLPTGGTFTGEINNNTSNSTTGNDGATNGKVIGLQASDPTETNVNFGIMLNNPVANDDAVTTDEDTAVTFNVTTNDTDPNNNKDVSTVDLDPITSGKQTTFTNVYGTWSVNASGVVTYTPAADYYGTTTLDYTIKDTSGNQSNVATVTYTVNPVNDVPSFTKGSNISINEDVGPQSITDWASNISKGPSNESLQVTWFTVNNDNNSLFAVQPYIDATGKLNYTPQPNKSGTTTVSVLINDDGGTANGGVNKSAIQTFTITINPVNDLPIALNDVNTTFINSPVSGQVLTNDFDPDVNPLKVTIQNNASTAHGTVTVNADGTYTYTPTTGYTGEDTFNYQVCDNAGACTTASVTIEVIPTPTVGNNPPVAVNDNYFGSINSNLSGKVLANDFDPDGNSLTVKSALVATGNDGVVNDAMTLGISTAIYGVNDAGIKVVAGNLTLIADGTFSFVPTNGFVGTVTYTYLNTDGPLTDDATVVLRISDVPGSNFIKAINDAVGTPKNTPATGNVLYNDFDPDNNTMTVSSVGTFATPHGSITISANGNYTFTPTTGYVGDDSYTYTVCDNGTPQSCSQATLTISVYPTPIAGNDAPVAVNDSYRGNANTTLTGNLRLNDLDPDGDNLVISSAKIAAQSDGVINDNLVLASSTALYGVNALGSNVIAGNLKLYSNGDFEFIPTLGFTGVVDYNYTISDGNGGSDTANVKFYIVGTNTTVAVDDSYIGNEDTPINGNVKANDYDPQGFVQTVNTTAVVAPSHGAVILYSNGTFTYTPDPNYSGTDQFVYSTCNNGLPQACDQATVYLNVKADNDPPIALNDVNTTFINNVVSGQVLTNDSDPEGNLLIVSTTLDINPSHGSVVLNANGTYTYTPTTGYTGEDSFSYELCDNLGACTTASVTIEVIPNPTAGNDPPVAVNDNYQGAINMNVSGTVLANDFDPEGTSLTIQSAKVALSDDGLLNDNLTLGSPTSIYGTKDDNSIVIAGSLTQNANGTFSFVPTSGFTGDVSYTYIATDGALTDDATVTIKIVNGQLVTTNTVYAINDAASTPKNTVVAGNVLSNDFDPENNTMTVSSPGVKATTAGGSISINANGTYSFTPKNNFIGDDTYTYTVCDNGSPQACSQATLTISVYPTPTGSNDAPVAVDDSYRASINTPVNANVISNDSDPDGNVLTVTSALVAKANDGLVNDALTLGNSTAIYGTNAAGVKVIAGNLTLNSSGLFSFVPTSGFIGTVDYSYTVSDGALTDTANVRLYITGNNNTVAVDDSFYGNEDSQITGNVKTNDYDPLGFSQTVNTTAVVAPLYGMVSLNANGTFTYTPGPNYLGTDQFVYSTCNNGIPQVCDQATVYLTSFPSVKATDDINQTPAGIPVGGNLLTNDKALSAISSISINGGTPVVVPSGGSATLNFTEGTIIVNSDGKYTFTPAAGYSGYIPPISYTATNSDRSDNAKLYIEVLSAYKSGINNPPVANHDVATTKQNVEITVKPLLNDSDPEAGTTFSVTKITDGKGNNITATSSLSPQTVLNIDGTVVGTAYIVGNDLKFTPNVSFTGDVPFTYEISDNHLTTPKTASSTINITVLPTIASLMGIYANDDANVKPKDVNMTGNVLTNDLSTGTGLTVTGATVTIGSTVTPLVLGSATTVYDGATVLGVITLSVNGNYLFDPAAGFEGTIPIVYKVKNDNGNTDQATLYLTTLPNKQNQLWVGTVSKDWNTTTNWKSGSIPVAGDDIEFATEANNPTVGGVQNSGPAKNDLEVPTGPTKVIGSLTNESSKALVIPAGNALVVNESIAGSETNQDRLIIKADNILNNGSLIVLSGCGTTIQATVELYARGDKNHPYDWTDNIAGSPTFSTHFIGKYSWQFFGVPVESIVANPTFYRGFLREYDESKNAPDSYYNKWTDLNNSSVLNAFKGYEVTQDDPTIYAIKGKLMLCNKEIMLTRTAALVNGSTDPNIENQRYGLGQNVFGNSFTAAIPIDQLDFNNVKYDGVTVNNTLGEYVEKTIYLYNTGSFGEWTNGSTVTEIATAGSYLAIPKNTAGVVYNQIPSMQGFLLRHLKVDNTYGTGTGKNISITLPYKELVKNDKPQTAPKAPLSFLEIELRGNSTLDQLWLFSQEGTSSAFDNGWDGRKFFGRSAAYLFAVSEAGNMQVNATDNLIGTHISFVPDGSDKYEMTIKKSNLGVYSSLFLADLFTGAVIALNDDKMTYQFTSTGHSGKDEQRFRIVASADRSAWKDNVYLNAYSERKDLYVSNWTNNDGRVSLYDMSGRKLMEQPISALIDKVIPVNFERGVYVIQLQAGEHQFSTKCIIR